MAPVLLKALIFDFDGTLAELHIDFSKIRRGITALGAAFDADSNVWNNEQWPILEKVQELSADLEKKQPGKGAEFASRCRLLVTAHEMDAAEKGKLFHYSAPVLHGLRKAGLKTAIITRNCTAAVKRVLPRPEQVCHVLLARDDVSYPKPHPDHVLRALHGLSIKPEQGILIGDHALDIQAAKAVGLYSAAVSTGNQSLQELREHKPDFSAGDLLDLMQQLYVAGCLPEDIDLTGYI